MSAPVLATLIQTRMERSGFPGIRVSCLGDALTLVWVHEHQRRTAVVRHVDRLSRDDLNAAIKTAAATLKNPPRCPVVAQAPSWRAQLWRVKDHSSRA